METLVEKGRSTPGEPQKNAVAVDFRKPAAAPKGKAGPKGKVPPMTTANPS